MAPGLFGQPSHRKLTGGVPIGWPDLVAFRVKGLERPKSNVVIIPNPLGVVRVGVGFHLLVCCLLLALAFRATAFLIGKASDIVEGEEVVVSIVLLSLAIKHLDCGAANILEGNAGCGGGTGDVDAVEFGLGFVIRFDGVGEGGGEGGSAGFHIHLFVGVCWNEDECA